MKEKLVVTNYDNFKNADFFKQQYLKAQEMLKETNDFYKSFCMSKLLTIKDALNTSPYILQTTYWVNYFVFPSHIHDIQVAKILKGEKYKEPRYSMYESVSDDEAKLQCKEYTKTVLYDFNKIIEHSPEYDCYFVLDKYNIIHEFIPVACKDTISIDFSGDDVIVSGYFFDYGEHGARFGKAESYVNKITKKIIINGATNNVDKVITECKCVETGNAGGKSYWDNHISYAMSSRDEKSVCTRKWYGYRRQIKERYDHQRKLMHNFYSPGLTIEDYKECLLKQFAEPYKEYFGKEITMDYINRCCEAWE